MESKIKLSSKGEGVIKFLKKYGYYIVVGIIAVAIAVTVILTSTRGGNLNINNPNNDDIPVGTDKLSFELPVLNGVILKDYSGEDLVWNQDSKLYETHKAIQLSSENLSVFSVLDGKVLTVSSDFNDGTKIVIEHANGFVSVYSSLAEEVDVKVGDQVKKGVKIGTMSDSAASEALSGVHLRFELLKDGQKINPNDYISFEIK